MINVAAYLKNHLALLSQYRSVMVALYFLFILVLGMTTFTHYGMSADELISRTNGGMSLNYIATNLISPGSKTIRS